MKYVIDLDEGQLSYIKNVCPGLATMGIASAIDDARPLSELCEEEAKKYQFSEEGGRWEYYRENLEKFNPSDYRDKDYLLTPAIIALRAFGSNS